MFILVCENFGDIKRLTLLQHLTTINKDLRDTSLQRGTCMNNESKDYILLITNETLPTN